MYIITMLEAIKIIIIYMNIFYIYIEFLSSSCFYNLLSEKIKILIDMHFLYHCY